MQPNRPARVVIVGGGPAGLATARAYRAAGGEGRVSILTDEPHLPYRRPPLTKEYLRGEIQREELAIEQQDWFNEYEVQVHRGVHVTALEVERGRVIAEDGEYEYDACVLATGSEPVRLPIPGGDDPGLYLMRTVDDSERLASAVASAAESAEGGGSRAIVIGSGFIGCEAAASLAMRGTEVTMVSDESLPQEARLGPDAGAYIADWLRRYGVGLALGSGLESIERRGERYCLQTAGGERLLTDTVLLATGVRPRLQLAEAAGLELSGGGVSTTESLRTSVPGVWAVGDIAYAYNSAAGRALRVEHWGDALAQGTVAGRDIAGVEDCWDAAPGFWSTIGEKTIKYSSWGDGWDEARLVQSADDEGFSVWYTADGATVGVLAHQRDEDYERGRKLLERKSERESGERNPG